MPKALFLQPEIFEIIKTVYQYTCMCVFLQSIGPIFHNTNTNLISAKSHPSLMHMLKLFNINCCEKTLENNFKLEKTKNKL
jgi:hypothetical protein